MSRGKNKIPPRWRKERATPGEYVFEPRMRTGTTAPACRSKATGKRRTRADSSINACGEALFGACRSLVCAGYAISDTDRRRGGVGHEQLGMALAVERPGGGPTNQRLVEALNE